MSYLLEIFKLLVSRQPLFLVHSPVDSDGWEVLLDQELSQGGAALNALDENHHLVELQHVQQLKKIEHINYCLQTLTTANISVA